MTRELDQQQLRDDDAKMIAAARQRRTSVPREEIVEIARASRIDAAAFRDDVDRAIDQRLER